MSAPWPPPGRRLVTPVDPKVVPPPSVQRFVTLPNGLEVACQSAKEADHIYADIFEHRVYLSHGITLWDGACVFDVGGNIGLFTVFLHQTYRNLVTYTFEPAPPLFDLLHHNTARYGGTCKLFPCGISNRAGTASFTFYPYSSGMSSFYGNKQEEREVLRTILENQRDAGDVEAATVLRRSEDFLDARLGSVDFACTLLPLSQIIRQEGVETIDLLKIDVQKSEVDVLSGIEAEDWPKIRQIVVEVHDLDGQLALVQDLLAQKGFEVVTEQDPLYRGSVMYNLYAVQKEFSRHVPGPPAREAKPEEVRPVAFLFAGVGDHFVGMGRDLYDGEPVFRAEVNRCAEILRPLLGLDIREVLYPAGAADGGVLVNGGKPDLRRMLGRGPAAAGPDEERLGRTELLHPALFTLEYALARQWEAWSVRPEAMIGYSIGEYVAACLAGVFSLEGALRLVARRARVIERLPAGAMLAVSLPEGEVSALLGEARFQDLSLAAVNGPAFSVVSGAEEDIAALERELTRREALHRRLRARHPFHSRRLEPALPDFLAALQGVELAAPEVPLLSNVTGTWITAREATDPGYWAEHMLRTVRFSDGLAELLRRRSWVLVEIGPGQSLSSIALQIAETDAGLLALPSLPSMHEPRPARAFLLESLERLRTSGAPGAGGRPGVARVPKVAPRTDFEATLRDLFQEVLRREPVGIHDNFFDLGGNSLVATRLISRVRELFGVEISLRAVFESPTVAELGGAIAPLEALRPPTITELAGELASVPRNTVSFGQERMWFLEQLIPGTAAYNSPMAMRLTGRLEVGVLAEVLREIARRHEPLRSRFPAAGGVPRLVIDEEALRELPLVDLSALPADRREQIARALAEQEARRPFALARGPLIRAALFRLTPEDFLLLLNVHHAIFDGWSKAVLVREMEILYPAFGDGRPSPLPDPPLRYRQFAAWQRRRLARGEFDSGLQFWREALAGLPGIELPADRPRPAVSSFGGARLPIAIPEDLSSAIKALAQREGLTSFMLLLAAFQASLVRCSGQEDIAIGTAVAGRSQAETEELLGLFTNTLVLRASAAGEPPFLELAARVRRAALDAFAHQEVPFERLVQELQPERDASRNPFFQVAFLLQNTPQPHLELPDVEVRWLELDTRTAKLDLSFYFWEQDRGFAGFLEYSSDLFDAATAQRYSERFLALLAGVARDPAARLAELQLLSPAERHQVAVDWNDRQQEVPDDPLVHRRFAEAARRRADAVALTCQDQELTYATLAERARGLARFLARKGVGPEVRVALATDRDADMVVALLAVLESGGAHVPLDLAQPGERLALILEDARPALVLTRSDLRDSIPDSGAPVICLDMEQAAIARATGEVAGPAGPEGLAYVIFTSGSTGRPKGVAVSHGALANFLSSMQRTPGLHEDDALLAVTTLSFDISNLELLLPLTVGARVVLARREEAGDARLLIELLARSGANVLQATPSTWQMLIDAGWQGDRNLLALCGGEALSVELAAALLPRVGALWNVYGPTETTIWSAARRVEPGDGRAAVPIGGPLANTQLYVLDAWGCLAPIGVPGELVIGGAGLARGYLDHPDLTAQRFVPDPFASVAGGRLYRTGDLARWRMDGSIDYVGRIDHQVKVRGFRVELGEIEAALAAHPGVERAVAVARELRPGDRQIVAYFTSLPDGAPSAAELRDHLRQRLPAYMVPTAAVPLAAWPLTLNGKIDRKALPAPELDSSPGLDVPSTPLEELLAAIWCRILGLEAVGSQSHFFDLGGHSLLGTQMLARLRESTGIELPLRVLFEAPTLAELARRAERASARSSSEEASWPPLAEADAHVVSFGQERLWLLEQLIPGTAAYHIPLALRLTGRLAVGALAAALREVARRHEPLRSRFPAADGAPRLEVDAEALIELPLVDLSALPAARREQSALALATEDARRPFDLSRGPLVRAALLRLAGDDHLLLWTVHHLVFDGWSKAILVREIAALQPAFREGRPSPLSDPPLSYRQYAAWQRRRLERGDFAADLQHWREALAGLSVLELPTDRPRRADSSLRGARLPFAIPEELTVALEGLARREGLTRFMLLLAAFQALLARCSGQEDVAVGSAVAGRSRTETEELVGLFTNTLVLRASVAGDPSFLDLAAQVRRTALDAFAHQEVPFERLVQELRPGRDASRNPLFQIAFVLQNTPQPQLALPEVEAAWLDLETGTAKFDLSLHLREQARGFAGVLEYSSELFDAATVRRYSERFVTLLAGVARDPAVRLAELPLLLPGEREQVLVEWNDTRTRFPREACIADLFAEQAARTPGAVALRFAGGLMTYAELERNADELSATLRAEGVGPDVLVGLCLERSPEAVVAILAVLKAGGAYVPLDPAYPAERLAWMLEDTAAPVVVTRRALLPRLPENRARLLLIDEPSRPVSSPPPAPRVWPESLAYVMYTSGSTGQPKGVAVTHRNVVRLVRENRYAELGDQENFLLLAPLAFDASTLEIWGPLLNGGTLVVHPAEAPTLEELSATLVREGITTLWLTAGLFHQMVETQLDSLRGLRQLLAGGDVLSLPHVERVLREAPGVTLINGYGPTESTTFACCHSLRSADGIGGAVPIGKPISNTRAYILDDGLRPVHPGAAGELFLGGDGLARGYLNRPDLTAERFVPDPHGPAAGEPPGGRLYRTGDLARFRPSGEIDFLGRIDQQVKIRGFRIEPGEIEALLTGHPEVAAAAVVAQGEGADKRLVAFLVHKGSGARPALSSFLARRLPSYMVPAAFLWVESLPLNANGKVDRRALARLAPVEEPCEVAAPRTVVEEVLAGIWAELLQRSQVGVEDSFFDLGGHSLLGTLMLSRLREATGIKLPLRDLFEAPTLAELARRAERSLIPESDAPPLVAAPRDGPLPLSFTQQRLWVLYHLAPESPAYNVRLALRLAGALRFAALSGALTAVVRRHEVLRTRFPEVDGEPRQDVSPPSSLPLPVVDLAGLPPGVGGTAARRLAAEHGALPFDLARGPLLRAALLRLGQDEHLLVLTVHHLVFDGWSVDILLRDLAALYEAALTGRPAALPDLALQYADFALWQRRALAGDVFAAQLDYWRRQLAGLPVLELSADRPRPAAPGDRGARCPVALEPELVAKLSRRRQGITPFVTLLSAFFALLARHGRQDDFAIGIPAAGNRRRETEDLIGFFVDTLVLRSQTGGDPSFAELTERTREVFLTAHAHQDVPFESLVDELQPERVPGYSPLFQVMFAFHVASRPRRLAEVAVEPVELESSTAKFDLSLSLRQSEHGVRGGIDYRTDLFSGTTIERLLAQWRTLLASAVDDPGRRLSELPILPSAERWQVLAEWNDTAVAFPADRCLHRLIEAQVERTPHAPAAVYEGACLSYRELDTRAERVADVLRQLGVGPEVAVGLFLERSLEMVAGILGVLKAGGAFIPFDTEHPRERLAFLLADTAVPVLLTGRALAARLPESGARVLVIEDVLAESPPAVASRRPAAVGPDSLCYVLYTSGSTGRPKGVMVSHRAACNQIGWAQHAYRLSPADRTLQKSPLTFDVAIRELFWPLATGACLHVVRPGGHRDSAYLAGVVAEQGITVLNFVPSLLQPFLEEPRLAECTALERVLAGGEVLSPELHDRFFARLPGVLLHNHYGPTETAVTATAWICRPGRAGWRVPIGRPIANARCHVLDEKLRPVPPGVPGELYVGGPGLARGYLGRPGLTADRFVPDPWDRGERLYRTGDLVRWLPEGTLDFLGRTDQQIKVRGIRIEPGEIETALQRHPSVAAAAVVADPQRGRLIAYWVPQAEAEPAPSTAELRDFLRRTLPEALVPALLVRLPALPLTVSGKLDRRALSPPHELAETDEGGGIDPRTPVEEMLASLWADLFEMTQVGVEDDFFDLGGNSLAAIQVAAQVRRLLAVEIAVRDVFAARTVAVLARRIEEVRRDGRRAVAPPIVPLPRGRDFPLSFAQERLWFLEQLDPDAATYVVPEAIRLMGPLDVPTLAAALQAVIARHEPLRTSFPVVGNGPVQRILAPGTVRLPLVDLGGLPAAAAERATAALLTAQARRPLDLTRGEVVRVLLLRTGESEHRLAITMHHIVFDGWSLRVLLREATALYSAGAQNRPPTLPSLPAGYADYAIWQREWLQGPVLEELLEYWRTRLAGAPEVLELPLDRPRPAVQTFRGAGVRIEIPPHLSGPLAAVARSAGATVSMVLLAGFEAMLGRWSGRDDLLLGFVVANRGWHEIADLIGFFVNTLVVRADLSGRPELGDLVERARRGLLADFERQDLPFERLVEALAPERRLSHTPLVQVMFSYDRKAAPRTAAGLSWQPGTVDLGVVKFDLEVSWRESRTGELTGELRFNRDLFDPATARRLATALSRALEAIALTPDRRLADLDWLDAAERHQLLIEWQGTRLPSPAEPVHRQIEAVARTRPAATALIWRGARLTYSELERRANRLAHRLRSLGAGPEVPVGVCLERSFEEVTALLAILKAGGAYLPLDPAHPLERNLSLLASAAAPLLVADHRGAGELSGCSARIVRIDLEGGETDTDNAPPQVEVLPDHLAYLIYTSGSTGQPKGVEVRHGGLSNLVAWHLSAFSVTAADRATRLSGLGFDASVWELWPYLAAGAAVHVPEEEVRTDPERLRDWLLAEEITAAFLPTPLAEALLAGGWPAGSRLRLLLTGGDRLSRRPPAGAPFVLVNNYGPTEATVVTTSGCVVSAPDGRSPEIGRAIGNVRVYLLDGMGRPVPIGVPGELTVGGASLARGYRGAPDLTAAAFVPDPVSGETGSRLYRTGDLARVLPDGAIEFLGRIDQQVKIRGLRIEPGEIEAALTLHPAVRESAVVARELAHGERELVAYVCPRPGAEVTAEELRETLRTRLPEAMIPAAFVQLVALPLTPNGKLDRAALPDPGLSPRTYEAPRDAIEEVVAGVWAEVLGRERVGIHDGFFELGGHSLKVARVASTLRDIFNVELPLQMIFREPTVARLSAALFRDEEMRSEALRIAGLALEVSRLSDEQVASLAAQGGA